MIRIPAWLKRIREDTGGYVADRQFDSIPSGVIRLRSVGYRYGTNWALRQVNLSIPPGVVAVLTGPNGSGKSSLLKLAAGLARPHEGAVEWLDLPLDRRSPTRLAQVSFVGQQKPLYPGLSISDHLDMGRRMNPTWDQEVADRLLSDARIKRNVRAKNLSGGERVQVAIALALAKRPRLLLMDEPLSELDTGARSRVLETVRSEVDRRDMSLIFSTHSAVDLDSLADYVIVVNGGKVVLSGSVNNILEDHRKMLLFPAAAPVSRKEIEQDWQVVDTLSDSACRLELIVRVRHRESPRYGYPAGWRCQHVTAGEVVSAHLRHSDHADVEISALGER